MGNIARLRAAVTFIVTAYDEGRIGAGEARKDEKLYDELLQASVEVRMLQSNGANMTLEPPQYKKKIKRITSIEALGHELAHAVSWHGKHGTVKMSLTLIEGIRSLKKELDKQFN